MDETYFELSLKKAGIIDSDDLNSSSSKENPNPNENTYQTTLID